MVTRSDFRKALGQLGVQPGDTVLIHSSFKSLGVVEGGAESIIAGAMDAVGKEGTLVLPTFTQKSFSEAYDSWHLDKHSDTGWLTNYFRKRAGSVRSDQATHSVAAAGRDAKWLTQTHGHTHKRFGNFGDTPFSADSPWEKMYEQNARIVLLGVSPMSITFRHYAEYVYVEGLLQKLENHPEYTLMKDQLWAFNKPGVWPHVNNRWVAEQLDDMGLVGHTQCGNAQMLSIEAKPFVEFVLEKLRAKDDRILWIYEEVWNTENWLNWRKRYEEIIY